MKAVAPITAIKIKPDNMVFETFLMMLPKELFYLSSYFGKIQSDPGILKMSLEFILFPIQRPTKIHHKREKTHIKEG
jgi:hypothetical protein